MTLRNIRDALVASAVRAVYGLLSATWRVERWDQRERVGKAIYAHWHGDELALIGPYASENLAVLVSLSRDGEALNRWLSKIGYTVVRGSSSRGAVSGLKALVDAVQVGGRSASLAVDGPRGPRGVVKPGVVKLSQLTQCPIVPGVAVASRAWVFTRSWNQCFLPKPFARVGVLYGKPIYVPQDISENDLSAIRLAVEVELHALKARAAQRVERALSGVTLPRLSS